MGYNGEHNSSSICRSSCSGAGAPCFALQNTERVQSKRLQPFPALCIHLPASAAAVCIPASWQHSWFPQSTCMTGLCLHWGWLEIRSELRLQGTDPFSPRAGCDSRWLLLFMAENGPDELHVASMDTEQGSEFAEAGLVAQPRCLVWVSVQPGSARSLGKRW